MKYYIGHLVKDFEETYREVVSDISKEFNLNGLLEKNCIPYITLKSTFEIDSITSIEELLEDFCKDRGKLEVDIAGLGHFNEKTIYFRVLPSDGFLDNHNSLLSKLQDIPNLPFSVYDNSDKEFHVSLIKHGEMQGRFEDIWSYLYLQSFNFPITIDNLTLFSKDKGKTRVHRVYDLG